MNSANYHEIPPLLLREGVFPIRPLPQIRSLIERFLSSRSFDSGQPCAVYVVGNQSMSMWDVTADGIKAKDPFEMQSSKQQT